MDAALKRTANPGFLLLAVSFFVLPGTWIFHLALVTGYAHGFQGMYGGYKSGRFKAWQLLLALATIYPLSLLPHILIVLLAAFLATLHFVTDEFHLYESRPTALTKAFLPGLLVLLIGTLCIFFRLTDKSFVLSTASFITLVSIVFFIRQLKAPTSAETGVLVLFFASALALIFLKNDQTSALVHLLGLMHFWSWYVEYYKRSKTRNGLGSYLKQSLSFFTAVSAIGVWGWFFESPLALSLLNPRLYFAWIIVHCCLSFRRQDIAQWLPSYSPYFSAKQSDDPNLALQPKSLRAD